jgi:hypothetical protein
MKSTIVLFGVIVISAFVLAYYVLAAVQFAARLLP